MPFQNRHIFSNVLSAGMMDGKSAAGFLCRAVIPVGEEYVLIPYSFDVQKISNKQTQLGDLHLLNDFG
jgi:hypothetical protein